MFTSENKITREFINQFIVSLLWSEHDDDGENMDEKTIYDISDETKKEMENRCVSFLNHQEVWPLFTETPDGYSITGLAHDFALTPNGHGVGFWDRGLDEIGERLTDISDGFGSFNLYIGDDGLVYSI